MTAPAPLKLFKELSRYWYLEVDTGDGTDDADFIRVRGLTSLALGIDPNEVDTTDFDSDGWDSKVVTHRSWALKADGFRGFTRSGTPTVKTYDPGQETCRVAALGTGEDAQLRIRMVHSETLAGYEGWANVSNRAIGGKPKDVEPLTLEFSGDGRLVEITIPAAP